MDFIEVVRANRKTFTAKSIIIVESLQKNPVQYQSRTQRPAGSGEYLLSETQNPPGFPEPVALRYGVGISPPLSETDPALLAGSQLRWLCAKSASAEMPVMSAESFPLNML